MTCFRMDNGETLHQYCLKNNINYICIYDRIENGENINEAVENYLKVRNMGKGCRHMKYFINGKLLTEYTNGSKNKLYRNVLTTMYRLHKTPEEALKMYGVKI